MGRKNKKNFMVRFFSRLLVLIMLITAAAGIMPAAAGAAAAVQLTSASTRNGGIWYSDERPSYNLRIINSGADAVTPVISYTVKSGNSVVGSGNVPCTQLNANSELIMGFEPEFGSKYGRYTLDVSVITGADTTNFSKDFSYVQKSEVLNSRVGISTHFAFADMYKSTNAERPEDAGMITDSGFGWVRDDCYWMTVEPKGDGKYQVPPATRAIVDEAYEAGKKVILVLSYGNEAYAEYESDYETVLKAEMEEKNYTGARLMPTSTEGIAAYANYCRFLATEFKGKVTAFELWNEPWLKSNSGHYTWTNAQRAAAYANLIKPAYQAIKEVDPNYVVLTGSYGHGADASEFSAELLEISGITNYTDGINIHPYTIRPRLADEKLGGSGSKSDFLQQIADVKSMYDAKRVNLPPLPIYISEFGASDYPYETDNGDTSKTFALYGEKGQALAMVRASLISMFEPRIKVTTLYNFKNTTTNQYHEAGFGFLNTDYTPKPVFFAMSYMNSLLATAEPVEETASGSASRDWAYYKLRDKTSGDDIFMIETTASALSENTVTAANKTAKLKVVYDTSDNSSYLTSDNAATPTITLHTYQGGAAEVRDIYGNMIAVQDGTAVNIGAEPTYVICSKPAPVVEPLEKSFSATLNEGVVSVVGATVPGSYVTAVANVVLGEYHQETEYIKQVTAEDNGAYSFSFSVDEQKAYRLSVYDGEEWHYEGFGAAAPVEPKIDVTANAGVMTIKGVNASPNGYITALVKKKNDIGGNTIAYIKQLKADSFGNYTFSFGAPDGDVYAISVFDGSKMHKQGYSGGMYDIDIEYYLNDDVMEDASQIKSGDTISVVISAKNNSGNPEGLIAYGAAYSDKAVMTVCSNSGAGSWDDDNKLTLTTEIKLDNGAEPENLKFHLWTDKLRPIINTIMMNTGK